MNKVTRQSALESITAVNKEVDNSARARYEEIEWRKKHYDVRERNPDRFDELVKIASANSAITRRDLSKLIHDNIPLKRFGVTLAGAIAGIVICGAATFTYTNWNHLRAIAGYSYRPAPTKPLNSMMQMAVTTVEGFLGGSLALFISFSARNRYNRKVQQKYSNLVDDAIKGGYETQSPLMIKCMLANPDIRLNTHDRSRILYRSK